MDEKEVIAEWNGRRFYGLIGAYGVIVITRAVPETPEIETAQDL